MDIIHQSEQIMAGKFSLNLEALFRQLSRFSLAATLICLPLHFRWVVQARPHPPLYAEYTNFYLYLTDIPLAMTLCLWLARLVVRPQRLSLRPRLLTFTLAGLWVAAVTSSLFSVDMGLSLYYTLRLLLLFGLYLFLINNPPSLAEVVAALGLQIVLQATIGIVQVLRQHSLGLAFLQELKLAPSAPGISIVWADGVRSLRAYGLTDHPNILGGSLACGLLLLAAAYDQARPNQRPWLAGTFTLGSLALLVTFSRSAWLGLIAGLVLLLAWAFARRSRISLQVWAGLLGAAALVLAPILWSNSIYLDSRLNLNGSFGQATPENQAINERTILIGEAVRIFAGRPFTGVGVAAFPQAFRQEVPDYPFEYQPPHFVLIEAAAETGLPGAGAYLLAMTAPWLLLLWHRPGQPDSHYNPVELKESAHLTPGLVQPQDTSSRPSWLPLAGITAALLAISIVSVLDYYPWLNNAGLLWQWLIWGLWGAWYQAA